MTRSEVRQMLSLIHRFLNEYVRLDGSIDFEDAPAVNKKRKPPPEVLAEMAERQRRKKGA